VSVATTQFTKNNVINIAISGAAGQIVYALLPRLIDIVRSEDARFSLRLLELASALPALDAIRMELEDCAYPFIDDIICTSDSDKAFQDADWIILVGAMPRKPGMERAELLRHNAMIFKQQALSIDHCARRSVQIIVVGNPCNTNAYIVNYCTPNIPSASIYALTMLDQHRAYHFLSKKLGVCCDQIENLCVWGNHSATGMFVDYEHAIISGRYLSKGFYGDDDALMHWCAHDLQQLVAQRGAQVLQARGSSSAASAANAIVDTLTVLVDRRPEQGRFSIGRVSHGEYGAEPGLVISYPCEFILENSHNQLEALDSKGSLQIVQNLDHTQATRERLQVIFAEIASEAEQVHALGILDS
tara:strand:+ start:566 stop:1639 length:1074 start_codon:yes stop_codon:yes gene_type:complete